jgi:TonB family protein
MRDAPLLDSQVSSTFTELNVRQDTGKPHFVRLHDSVVRDLERQLQGGREQSGILIGSIEGSGHCTIAVEEFEPAPNLEERIRAGDGARIVGFYRSHSRRDFAPESADRALFQRCFSRDARLLLLLKPPKTDVGTAMFFLGENGQLTTDRATVEFPFNLRELGAEESPEAAAPVVEAAAKAASGGGLVWKLGALSVAVIASVVGFSGVFDSQKTQTQPPVAVEQPAIVEPPPAVEPPVAAVQSKKPKPAIPPAPLKAVKTIVTPPRVEPPRKPEPVTMPVEQPVVVADNAAAKPASALQPAPMPQPRTVTPPPPSAPPARPIQVQVPKPVEPTAPLIAPHATRQFAPMVPDNVRRSITGEVVIKVRVSVDASGKVTAAEALSTGNAVAESLAAAAISAVKKWQFEPARRGEEKVAGEVALSFTFRK